MSGSDPEALRAELRDRWERAAPGWGRHAARMREFGMPVSNWMIEHAELKPGLRVLELAAGPGDTGFMAAERIRPGGVLISSDAAEGMLEIARARAGELGIENVEFKQLELEWIDLSTASVDVIICRWGLMFAVDPEAALREARRVLVPGGRIVLAAWDEPERNPWATLLDRAMVELGFSTPPDPGAPGMFALAAPSRLQALLEDSGFVEPVVESVELPRPPATVREEIAEKLELARTFADAYERLSGEERQALERKVASLGEPYADADGRLMLGARSLVASASA